MLSGNNNDTGMPCLLMNEILEHVAGKWSIYIVKVLYSGPHRFNKLLKSIPGISQRMLTRTLRNLERDGLVRRDVYDTNPPSVEYSLTALGLTLEFPIGQLCKWAHENYEFIKKARIDFDES
jgi:DNA-binding HxlR family transcriptional regulator